MWTVQVGPINLFTFRNFYKLDIKKVTGIITGFRETGVYICVAIPVNKESDVKCNHINVNHVKEGCSWFLCWTVDSVKLQSTK